MVTAPNSAGKNLLLGVDLITKAVRRRNASIGELFGFGYILEYAKGNSGMARWPSGYGVWWVLLLSILRDYFD